MSTAVKRTPKDPSKHTTSSTTPMKKKGLLRALLDFRIRVTRKHSLAVIWGQKEQLDAIEKEIK